MPDQTAALPPPSRDLRIVLENLARDADRRDLADAATVLRGVARILAASAQGGRRAAT